MKKFVYSLFTFICFMGVITITNAKSVTCTYTKDALSVTVGLDENGNMIKQKNDSNPVVYKFDLISSGAFINDSHEYYCPSEITYKLSYNPTSKRNDFEFSFIKDVDYPQTLSLSDSIIDNNSNDSKEIDHFCAYGDKGKYIINYYTDGTIGSADTSYAIKDDIPATGECLPEVYLCAGPVIAKNISWDNNNCIKISQFTESFVQTDPSENSNMGGLQIFGIDLGITKECSSYLGNPEYNENVSTQSPAYYLQFIFNIMKYIAIIMLVVLTIVEYVKAVVAKNEDGIKKATQNTIKRVIIVVIIFLLPELIKFLLTVLGAYSPGTCGIK